MQIKVLKSKIHRARVTGADVDYVWSLTLDPALAEMAGLMEYEHVLIASLGSGARLETYVILGEPGDVRTNGAAAKLIREGERVIIMSFAQMTQQEAVNWKPKVVVVDEENRPVTGQQ